MKRAFIYEFGELLRSIQQQCLPDRRLELGIRLLSIFWEREQYKRHCDESSMKYITLNDEPKDESRGIVH